MIVIYTYFFIYIISLNTYLKERISLVIASLSHLKKLKNVFFHFPSHLDYSFYQHDIILGLYWNIKIKIFFINQI